MFKGVSPPVWVVFTQQHLQADQNVWCARKLLSNWFEFRKRRSNSAECSTGQTGNQALKHQHDIRLLFKMKNSVLTPAHTSQKKRQFYLLLWHIPIAREWSRDTALCRTQNATGGGCREAEENQIGDVCSGHVSSGNLRLSTDVFCSWVGSKLDNVLTTNKLYQSLFGRGRTRTTGPRRCWRGGFGPVVVVRTWVRLMCSHLPKRTVPRE